MENERLRIELDKSNRVYVAGETIKGRIYLNVVKRTKLQGK